jgi:hypothetical protein
MLSRQKQRWMIKTLLDGKTGSVDVRQMDDPFLRSCFEAIRAVPAADRRYALIEYLTAHYGNWKELYDSLNTCSPPREGAFASYADLAPSLPPIDWFWEGWIPNRLLSALAAPPGAGKSMIALDLARRTMAGELGPDGAPIQPRSSKVIYVDAENIPQITMERARTWGMALDHLYPMLPPPYGIIDFDKPEERDRLIEMANALHPGLIVIDSLSMVSNQGDTNVEEVRPLLTFLAALANDADCAVLLIHHTRKRARNALPGRQMTLDDVRGSGHIVAACRSLLGLSVIQTGPLPDPNGPRKLQILKTNLGTYPDPLGVRFFPCHPQKGVEVHYGDPPHPYLPPTTSDRCAEWLLSTLAEAGEPLRPREIVHAAQEAGFTRSAVYKARRQLGAQIANTAGRRNPENKWGLADEPDP